LRSKAFGVGLNALGVDLNPLGAENKTGRAERPTSWEARSQDVELCYSPISIWADLTM
jgi:hypothetical protein